MPIVPTSLIKRPTAILSNILMIVVISLTAVPSVLHAVALRRVVCEFPRRCCIKSLRLKKKRKNKRALDCSRAPRRQLPSKPSMAFRLLAVWALLGAASAASDESIEDLMASLKGMPGMEGIKMFTVTERAHSC
jgi:hypothetical protein